jgi:hypothetical protein
LTFEAARRELLALIHRLVVTNSSSNYRLLAASGVFAQKLQEVNRPAKSRHVEMETSSRIVQLKSLPVIVPLISTDHFPLPQVL